MYFSQLPRSSVLACGLALVVAQTAFAAPQDYQFQVVEPEFRQGDRVTLTIAITDMRTNTAVDDATIIAVQMDMSTRWHERHERQDNPCRHQHSRSLRLCRQTGHGGKLASCHRRALAR